MITKDTPLLLVKALEVIDEAYTLCRYAKMAPLFSGGHDSYCACFVASQHPKFRGDVYHINTGIGSKATMEFVREVCKDEGWKLNILSSPWETFEWFVKRYGFPGPSQHGAVYRTIKDRALRLVTKSGKTHHPAALITGCRSQESVRRMGNTAKIKVGAKMKNGRTDAPYRIWVAPCHDWSSQDQRDFMDCYNLPRNPVKESLLGMSGECFCGAFARPGELELLRKICPDVAQEIDRLSDLAKANGKPCEYGGPRNRKLDEEILETGPLCTSCDLRARQAGLNIKSTL